MCASPTNQFHIEMLENGMADLRSTIVEPTALAVKGAAVYGKGKGEKGCSAKCIEGGPRKISRRNAIVDYISQNYRDSTWGWSKNTSWQRKAKGIDLNEEEGAESGLLGSGRVGENRLGRFEEFSSSKGFVDFGGIPIMGLLEEKTTGITAWTLKLGCSTSASVNKKGESSSSSIRTVSDRDPEIPDLEQCGSFDFMNEDELLGSVPIGPLPSPPLSPRTLDRRRRIVEDSLRVGPPPVSKLESYVDLANGYRYRVPTTDERVWMMPEYGMHGIPLILFHFGLQLPMHPFFLAMFEAIGCGVSQLTPNSLAQLSGFVALCCDRNLIPTFKLFFSIYAVRYHDGQVYFDCPYKRVKIVSVRSSNSGYHSKWLYFGGPDLEFVKPCGKVSQLTIDYLNNLEKHDAKYLNGFHGVASVYTHLQLKEPDFLEMHDLAGASLEKILNSGVKGEMDKAMMLLIKRASKKGDDGAPSGPSRVGHSVSIELLDDQGNRIVEDVEKDMPDVEPTALNPRKRGRREVEGENCVDGGTVEGDASVGGVNKTLTLVGNRATMAPTIDPRQKKGVVRVDIQPHERWTGGTTVPLRVFDLFHLPQDAVAFDGRRREDLADRCKSRAGRLCYQIFVFLADFMHIVEEFRTDGNDAACKRLEAEVSSLRVEKKKLMAGYSELEKRSSYLKADNTALSKKVGEMEVGKQSLNATVSELERRLSEVEKERDELKGKCEGLERHVDGMNSSYRLIVEENTSLKAEVEKAVEDIASALGDGYGRCVVRMQNAGLDTTGHSFEDYIRDLAASRPDDPAGGS
ncbi:hypothetical protein AgCh_034701 [Apium graveolens]